MSKTKPPTAPRHLEAATRKWWKAVTEENELQEHHLKLLTLAAESWDRVCEARVRIAEDGAYLKDRFSQLKAHPAIAVERDAKTSFARLLRELSLDIEPPADVRPPRRSGTRG